MRRLLAGDACVVTGLALVAAVVTDHPGALTGRGVHALWDWFASRWDLALVGLVSWGLRTWRLATRQEQVHLHGGEEAATRPSRRWSAWRTRWWTGWSGGLSGLRKGAMRYATMLTMAERAAGLVRPDVERAVEAALRTLAGTDEPPRQGGGHRRVPGARGACLAEPSAPEPAEGFDHREFIGTSPNVRASTRPRPRSTCAGSSRC